MLAVSLEGKAIVLGLCQYPLVPTPLAAFPPPRLSLPILYTTLHVYIGGGYHT